MLWCTTPPGSFRWSTWLQLSAFALSLHLQAAPTLCALTCLKSFTCSSGPINLKNEWKHELKSGEWACASAVSSHHCWQHYALYMTTVTNHYPGPALHPCTIFSSIIHQSIHWHSCWQHPALTRSSTYRPSCHLAWSSLQLLWNQLRYRRLTPSLLQ